jgi:hypothetical protein
MQNGIAPFQKLVVPTWPKRIFEMSVTSQNDELRTPNSELRAPGDDFDTYEDFSLVSYAHTALDSS